MADDDDTDDIDFRSLGSHGGFELIATRQVNGWWRVMAIADKQEGERTSAERTALVVSDPLLRTAENIMRERIDRWRRMRP
jgi:hypothetical protein